MKILTPDEISRLTTGERLALIGRLWDSLDGASSPLSGPQRLEIERRLATFDEDLADAVTWEELKAELATRAA